MEGGDGNLTRRKAVNNILARPVLGVLVVSPVEICVPPEIVEEMLGIIEGLNRFPPEDEPRQQGIRKQCTDD